MYSTGLRWVLVADGDLPARSDWVLIEDPIGRVVRAVVKRSAVERVRDRVLATYDERRIGWLARAAVA